MPYMEEVVINPNSQAIHPQHFCIGNSWCPRSACSEAAFGAAGFVLVFVNSATTAFCAHLFHCQPTIDASNGIGSAVKGKAT